MLSLKTLFFTLMFSMLVAPVFAKSDSGCCSKMGGINYCDSSAGRLVCNNGFYSVCYCTPHAVMDLQLLKGCCLWKGGVMPPSYKTPVGLVLCNDGSISEECSLQIPQEKIAAW